MRDPVLISMDTKLTENSFNFIKTLTHREWNFKIIGTNLEWKGFINRMETYLEELKTLDKNQICILSDARDVLCLRPPTYFNNKFLEFNSNIVVSGEMICGGYSDPKYYELDPNYKNSTKLYNCYPMHNFWKAKGYDINNLPNRKYLNAGLISGYCFALIEMLEWSISKAKEQGIDDDQYVMGMYIDQNPENVTIDIDAELLHSSVFGATGGILNRKQSQDSPTISEILGKSAFFLHLPGCGLTQGNGMVYEMVWNLLKDNKFNNKELLKLYGINEVKYDWYQEEYLDEINKKT
jgi:hypothetical protein